MTIDLLSFLCAVLGYGLGAIPTAWLIVRSTHSVDIRNEGTGNVGAMNSYDVTGKKRIGILIAILDALKGVAAVLIARAIGADFFGVAVAAIFAVIGHCYNVFLKFHGGRGLATSAGIALAINPLVLILWVLMYLTGYYVIRRDVHVGSMSGILGVSILLYTTPSLLLQKMMQLPGVDITQFKAMVWLISAILFVRHLEPIRDLFRRMQTENNDSDDAN